MSDDAKVWDGDIWDGEPEFPTITEAEFLLPHAKKTADALGIPHEDAPLGLGFINTDPAPQEAIDLGRKLAARYGW